MNFKIIGKLVSLRLVYSVLGLAYSALQVRIFGASSEMDAFFIATTGLYVITSLTQSGHLAEVFLPEYLKLKKEKGSKMAFRLFSAMINRMTLVGILLFIVLYAGAPWLMKILGSGLNPVFEDSAVELFRASLCLIIFILIGSFTNTLLNAEKVYGRVELNALLNSVVSISLLLTLQTRIGVWVLLLSLLAGKIIEFVIGFVLLHRIGYRYQLCWKVPGFSMSAIFRVMIPTSGYVLATQSYIFILTHFSSYLPEGSFSLFKYVQQISQKASSLVIDPLSSVFFSEFAHRLDLGSQALIRFIQKPLFFILMITSSAFFASYWMGVDFLRILWAEKSISEVDYQYCELLLNLFFASYIAGHSAQLFRKAAVSLGAAKKLYFRWTFSQLLTALFAAVLIPLWGLKGLALIPLINTLLLSLVSFEAAHSHGISFIGAMRFPEIQRFGVFLLAMTAIFLSAEYFFQAPIYPLTAIFKLGIFLFVFFLLVVFLFRKEFFSKEWIKKTIN
jgi:putative peptidoglycan lipid II flippase